MSIAPSNDALLVVLCTCPPRDARRLAEQLVQTRLAACVNILPAVTSVYRWQDDVVDEDEALMIIKTTAERREELFHELAAQHPYTVPEIVSLPSNSVLSSYHAWVIAETTPCSDQNPNS